MKATVIVALVGLLLPAAHQTFSPDAEGLIGN